MQINIIKFDLQAEEERINREKQLEQEERMAKELARINYERQREEKIRQYIKENRYTHLFHYLDLWYILGQCYTFCFCVVFLHFGFFIANINF